jgi:hypothetical protein
MEAIRRNSYALCDVKKLQTNQESYDRMLDEAIKNCLQ